MRTGATTGRLVDHLECVKFTTAVVGGAQVDQLAMGYPSCVNPTVLAVLGHAVAAKRKLGC